MANGGVQQVSGQRGGARAPVGLSLEVEGRHDRYVGQTVNLSGVGALVWINDERFASKEDARNLVLFSERIETEFQDSMRVHFTNGVVVDCDVVRVERGQRPGDPLLVACSFSRPLDPADCRRLGVNPSKVLVGDDGKAVGPEGAAAKARPAPKAKAATKRNTRRAGRHDAKERRTAQRVDRVFYALVTGDSEPFKAHILNLSCTGALLTITDPALPAPAGSDELIEYTKTLGDQFGSGMLLRILEGEVNVQGDVVRVSERPQGDETLVIIGVRFRRNLTLAECERLEIHAPKITADPASASVETNPYTGKSPIRQFMTQAMESGATDLHIKVGSPPRARMGGTLLNIGKDLVTEDQSHAMALELMSREMASRFERDGDVELSMTIEKVGRFRVNVLRQRGMTGLAIRCIPDKVPSIDDLGLHPLARTFAEKPRGLVLVTGATGSGKSTTLAALVDHVNRTRACHILTMEDPIEYVHRDVEAHITQREIGRDAVDFKSALRRALRQDPDVIMVGELRDLETISLALTAAETGHLVFATLHTTSAVLTPDRIVGVFPHGQQQQIRIQLADSLQGVMAQMLLPRADDHPGMALVQEVLVATEAVRALIREHRTPQLLNMMQTGAKSGMTTLESALNELVQRGVITYETAIAKAHFPKQIRRREARTA